jgi:hypothetical protein
MKRQPKKMIRPRVSSKKIASRKNARSGKPSRKKNPGKKRSVRGRAALVEVVPFELRGLGPRSGGQAGDLQGLSAAESAASESVEELLEEGNAFEAEVVKGVEDAEGSDEIEVETHEILEDDVPKEYQDQD